MLGKTLGFILLLGLATASDCLAESCHVNSANASLYWMNCSHIGTIPRGTRVFAEEQQKCRFTFREGQGQGSEEQTYRHIRSRARGRSLGLVRAAHLTCP
jgi:hypothetical protein